METKQTQNAFNENDFSDILVEIVNNESMGIRKKVGKWLISNMNSPQIIDMFYNEMEAIYSCSITENEEFVDFYFPHREVLTERRKGTGTETLKSIEESIKQFSIKSDKKCRISFTSSQNDVNQWLEKNEYTYETFSDEGIATRLYSKEI